MTRQQRYDWTEQREELIVKPDAQTVGGGDAREVKRFDTGEFKGDGRQAPAKPCLGEILTDEYGRLVVLAGNGEAFSVREGHTDIKSDFDNENWIDTMGDGPVMVSVMHGSWETAK